MRPWQGRDWHDRNEVYDYLCRILRRGAADRSGKIYVIGHAVYTLSDPRAVYLAELAEQWAHKKDRLDEYRLFKLVAELAPAAFAEVRGAKKKVCANVDFYSGFVLDSIGIPQELYTPPVRRGARRRMVRPSAGATCAEQSHSSSL